MIYCQKTKKGVIIPNLNARAFFSRVFRIKLTWFRAKGLNISAAYFLRRPWPFPPPLVRCILQKPPLSCPRQIYFDRFPGDFLLRKLAARDSSTHASSTGISIIRILYYPRISFPEIFTRIDITENVITKIM